MIAPAIRRRRGKRTQDSVLSRRGGRSAGVIGRSIGAIKGSRQRAVWREPARGLRFAAGSLAAGDLHEDLLGSGRRLEPRRMPARD